MNTGDPGDIALKRRLAIQGAMFFPDDERRRRLFLDVFFGKAADLLVEKGAREQFGTTDVLHLHEMARIALKNSDVWDRKIATISISRRKDGQCTRNNVSIGYLVSRILLIPLVCNVKYGRIDVGKAEAIRIILESNEEDPTGKRNIQKAWQQYEPVAHFWAAWALFDCCALESLSDVTGFISIAECLRHWGERYIPLRARVPLLDAQRTVKVSESWIWPLRVTLSELLADFEPPEQWAMTPRVLSDR
jgi:hypothetical protein